MKTRKKYVHLVKVDSYIGGEFRTTYQRYWSSAQKAEDELKLILQENGAQDVRYLDGDSLLRDEVTRAVYHHGENNKNKTGVSIERHELY